LKITHAYIEITNICNLNCRSCYNRSGEPHKEREIPPDQMSRIAYKLNEWGCGRVSLSGGEPTLHTEFDRMLCLLLQYPDLQISVSTNGTTNSRSLSDAFNIYDNVSLQISLDGSCEAVNAVTRGRDNFRKTIAFLLTLKESEKKPALKMTVSQSNYSDVGAFYELAVSLNCIPEFDFIGAMGNAKDNWPSLGLSAKQKLDVLRTINRLNKKHGVNAALPYCTSSCPLSVSNADHSVLIKCDGSVHPCQMLYGDKFALGNILTDSAKTLEASFMKIAETVRAREATDYGCEKCLARSFCKKGCMALADMTSGDPLASDGECGFRKIQILGFHAVEQGALK